MLIVTEWMVFVHSLPTSAAVLAMGIFVAAAVLGLRGERYFISLAVGIVGWFFGAWLADLMYVTPWYIATPVALFTSIISFIEEVAEVVRIPMIAFVCGCTAATLGTYGLAVSNFWVGFAVGAIAGAVFAVLVRRFMTTILFSAVGAMGIIACFGALIDSESGFFSRGGYQHEPVVLAIITVVLVMLSMVSQLAFEPEVL